MAKSSASPSRSNRSKNDERTRPLLPMGRSAAMWIAATTRADAPAASLAAISLARAISRSAPLRAAWCTHAGSPASRPKRRISPTGMITPPNAARRAVWRTACSRSSAHCASPISIWSAVIPQKRTTLAERVPSRHPVQHPSAGSSLLPQSLPITHSVRTGLRLVRRALNSNGYGTVEVRRVTGWPWTQVVSATIKSSQLREWLFG